MKILKFVMPLVVFIIIVSFLWKGLKQDPHTIPSPLIGKAVPNFSYPSLANASSLVTNKQFLGHITLLNVWATWCISCRAEHPILMDVAKTKQVAVYGLNYKDDRAKALAWLKTYGNPYQNIIYDDKGTLAINFGVYGTPESFIIDDKGIIRYKYIGPISPNVWQEEILPEINKLAASERK